MNVSIYLCHLRCCFIFCVTVVLLEVHASSLLLWYDMVNVNLYSAIVAKSNALSTLVAREKPDFQALSKGLIVLLCAEVVRQGVPDHGALYSECLAANSG